MMMEMMDQGYSVSHCLCCLRFQRFIIETHTMYKIGLLRIGILLTMLSAACLPCGGALMAVNQNTAWSGIGIWCGVPALLCGVSCIIHNQKRPSHKVSFGSCMCVVAIFAASFLIITSIVNLSGISRELYRIYPSYKNDRYALAPLYICNTLLLGIGCLQLPCAILAFMHFLGTSCACCRGHMDGVFTIDDDPGPEETEYQWDPYDTPEATSTS